MKCSSYLSLVTLKRPARKGVPDMVRSRQAENAVPKGMEQRKRAGGWLQERRKAAGLSQIELAQRLGLKYYTFISQVENGFGRVPSDSMEPWARALGHCAGRIRTPPAGLL